MMMKLHFYLQAFCTTVFFSSFEEFKFGGILINFMSLDVNKTFKDVI